MKTLDGRGWAVSADLSDPAGPQALWDRATAIAGRLTGLVNNAGIRSSNVGLRVRWTEREMIPMRRATLIASFISCSSSR